MAGLLLDTNVLSELRRPQPDAKLVEWWRSAPEDLLYISALTVGEIRYGIARLQQRQPERALAIDTWLRELSEHFVDRLLAIDADVAERWGELRAVRPLPVVDSLVAATALVHRLTLVTRNARDFAGTGVPLLNPFSD